MGTGERAGRACVLGLARSGLGATRLLLGEGRPVRALELKPTEEILARWAPLAARGAELVAGPHPIAALDGCDLLVRSPGVPDDAPVLGEARRRGMAIVSEVELAAARVTTPMIAVTGTNGKSTTTAWAAHLLQRAGRAAVACGNIGRPLSDALLDEPAGTVFVIEVSSFQLQDSPRFHPRAATILNLTPDHLDRHGGYAAYVAAKWAIARNQTPEDWLAIGPGVAPPAEPPVRARVVRFAPEDPGGPDAIFARAGRMIARRAGIETPVVEVARLSLPGPHNLTNAMAAFALTAAIVPEPARLAPGLCDFGGLAHRLETVGTVGGVRFINDSKATNVDSVRVALQSFEGRVVLIAGGRDKAGPFEEIAELVTRKVRRLIAVGEAAARVREAWPAVPAETARDFEDAVRRAYAAAAGEGIVLLSPGCASFDLFRSYEHRGEVFRQIVARLAQEEGR
jgi:UDP-N-acetylmuramoylalanine--D-glutamate ligase